MKEVISDTPAVAKNNSAGKKAGYSIRHFEHKDALKVADLMHEHFPWTKETPREEVAKSIIEDHPETSPVYSLVCVSGDDEVHGFMGVEKVDFVLNGKPVKGAYSTDFAISDEARRALMSIRMMQKVMNGDHDFSFSYHAVKITRLLWCRLGGEIAHPHSIYYTVPLRPFKYLASKLLKSKPALNKMISAAAEVPQKIWEALNIPYFRVERSLSEKLVPLTPEILQEGLSVISSRYDFYQAVDHETLSKYLKKIESDEQNISVAKAVYDQNDNLIGWFIYLINTQKRISVLHAQSMPGKESILFKNLVRDAFQNGGIIMNGRFTPEQLYSIPSNEAVPQIEKQCVLIHSKNEEILQAFRTEKALLDKFW